jgi:hypothetical protein
LATHAGVVAALRFFPVTVMTVPAGPLVGVKELMLGAGVAKAALDPPIMTASPATRTRVPADAGIRRATWFIFPPAVVGVQYDIAKGDRILARFAMSCAISP